jgi:NAD(P)-dependent dehydrogenase (short-subunit alcohol dehydrogenase family)
MVQIWLITGAGHGLGRNIVEAALDAGEVHMGAELVAKSHHHVNQWFDVPPYASGHATGSKKHILRQWVSLNPPDIFEAWRNDMYSLFATPTT